MLLYIIFATITCALAYRCMGKKQLTEYGMNSRMNQGLVNRICFCGLFLLLFLFSSLRYKTGNDYLSYVGIFHDVFRGNYVVTETGFNLIVSSVYEFLNEENYLILFAMFAGGMVIFFLRGMYLQSRDFGLTFLLYMCLSLYFQSFSTVRYYFALSIVFIAMHYFCKKDYIKGIIIILIASLFHKSSLIVIPIYILSGIKWKKIHVILVTLFATTGIFLKEQYLAIMLKLYPSYVTSGEYIGAGGVSIVNIVRCLAVLVIAVIFYDEAIKDNDENRFYFYLNYAALLIFTFFSFIPYGSRIGYYMNISHILFLPSIIKCIKKDKIKRIMYYFVIMAAIIYFLVFLYTNNGTGIKVLPYRTWLFESLEFVEK